MSQQLLSEVRNEAAIKILLDPTSLIATRLYTAIALLGQDPDLADQDILDLDPETILIQIQQLIGRDLGDLNRAKLIWGLVGLEQHCLDDLPTFIEFCNYSVAEQDLLPGVFDPANLQECCQGVVELSLLRFAGHDGPAIQLPLSPEIARYCGAIAVSEGVIRSFRPISFAVLSEPDLTDDPALFNTVHENSQWLVGEIRTDLERQIRRSFSDLAKIRTDRGPVVTRQDLDAFLTQIL